MGWQRCKCSYVCKGKAEGILRNEDTLKKVRVVGIKGKIREEHYVSMVKCNITLTHHPEDVLVRGVENWNYGV